jgi:hypothetical protein
MKSGAIISRGESLQILRNDLRKLALEKHAASLKTSTAEERQKIMEQIDKDVEKDLQCQMKRLEPHWIIH